MKNYKDYDVEFIGNSDIASLTLRAPMRAEILNFGEDNSYMAYIVDKDAEIGSHYKLEYTFDHWLKVYDDDGLVRTFTGDIIKVYSAGQMGCIIQIIKES